jgi:dipeptidyl aminopeptidase/acylaminoacyl peptidase
MRRFVPVLAVLFAITVPSSPLYAEAPKRDHDITVDDYFTLATLFECAISPDGKQVAYTEGRWQKSTDDRKADLWVVEVSKPGAARRLTSDRAGDRKPQWSSDGKTLYFLGNRKREGEKRPPYDGKTQVWKVAVAGGEPSEVTRIDDSVTMYTLGSDGKSLYYVTETNHVADEWKNLRETFKDVEYGHGVDKVSQVWKLDLQNWRVEKLIDDKRYIHDLAISPDGRRLAMFTTPDDKVVSFEGKSRVDVYDAQTKTITAIPDKIFRADAASPYGWLEHLDWSTDGSKLAFNVIFDGYPAEIIVAEFGGLVPTVSRITRPKGFMVKGYGSPVAWRGKSELSFLGEEKGRVRLCSVDVSDGKSGDIKVLTPGDVVVQSLSVNATGGTALILNGPTTFEDIYVLDKGEKLTQLTDSNPQSATWKLPRLSVVSWKGANGDPVEGILELPPDNQGQPMPLVVCIHGGPTAADYYHLQFWIYGRVLLPAKGYAVLCPNYRGSTGYGDKFLTDLIGRENDLDVADILKGVDYLIEKGIVDPNKLGVSGWSNGGYLTNCIITKDQRFKAASSGAGIVDTIMEWGANDEPAYANVFKKGFPWNASENYHKASSTYQLDKVRTPTLIHVGGSDDRCPPAQSRMLYRALKEYVKVPTELCVYPGESHGLMKYKNRQAKMEWDLAWFDRYILGKK